MNITILADGKSMQFRWESAKAPNTVSCAKEAFTWQAGVGCTGVGCGTMDVSAAMADPGDCLARSAKAEGGVN